MLFLLIVVLGISDINQTEMDGFKVALPLPEIYENSILTHYSSRKVEYEKRNVLAQ